MCAHVSALPPGLPIGAVAHATGIPVSTLRTWERRYGFPSPDRTAGGQRVYPPEVVPHLGMVVRAIDAGMRPAQVLRLTVGRLQDLLAAGHAPRGAGEDRADPRWVAAVRDLDGQSLELQLRTAWDHLGGLRFLDERAVPFLRTIGRAWATGELEVFHERFASQRLQRFLATAWQGLSDGRAGPVAVCAVLAPERHELPLHLVSVAFALAGWRPFLLGEVPGDQVATCAHDTGAAAVAISVSGTAHPVETREALGGLRRMLQPGVHLVVGGAGAPPRLPGTGFFADLRSLAAWAEAMS